MNTSNPPQTDKAFAVWLTGLPASGKSTVTAALVEMLSDHGVHPAVLESDVWRKILTPNPTYTDEDREVFYNALVSIGRLLVGHGVPVIFDATANRRAYRDHARAQIERFVEVYVDSPLEICARRDPKGIYRRGREEQSEHVPGLQAEYEPPDQPEVIIHGDRQEPGEAARSILIELERRGYIPGSQ